MDRVEPMLKQLGNYPHAYLKPVAHALDYAHALADKVPGPVSITPESYSRNPVVHAMFRLPEDLHTAFEVSRAMTEFQRQHPDITSVYGLVCMRRKVKDLFGVEMHGEVLRRDVRQEAVYFTDFTLAEPGLTEEESRRRIAQGFFESLVTHVANRVMARKVAYEKAAVERDEWLSRLRTAEPKQRDELQAELEAVLLRMADMVRSLELERYCRDYEAILSQPEAHLYLERTEMNLDSMGIKRGPGEAGSEDVTFCDLIGRDRRRWTVVLIYCNHVKTKASITDNLEKAQRWLGF